MDWHRRYLQQAGWTRELRSYLFKQAGLSETSRVHRTPAKNTRDYPGTARQGMCSASLVLEVGCGTGAVLSELRGQASLHGLDIDPDALAQCQVHVPSVHLVQGDALRLPYLNASFDIVYCHFLLLWVKDPLQALREMKRTAKAGAHILAFAEPDYTARLDEPPELIPLGQWQTESLRRQGADPGLGAHLADLFFRAGIELIETGTIQGAETEPSAEDWETEWAVIESDLAGFIPREDILKMKNIDQRARAQGTRLLNVPTYFASGRA